ncbi:MAG TPA: gephyrin-like molybdotransferase Glp [Pseudonocardiaceae bacterium]|nr:gephyrin-like molybdotransferase Glp [Pseudonocardiaceae bacterium]
MPRNGPATAAPVSIESHRARVFELVGDLPVVELPVADCLGLVLAADLVSTIPLPPFDNSAMDGYAVRARDVAAATEQQPVELPVPEDIPAGRTDVVALEPGTAHRIMTGAAMPPGADSIVQVELTDAGVQRVRVYASVRPGSHLRHAGEDVRVGDTVLAAGTELGPMQLGVASAVGAATLPVRRRPRVLVVSTGSELVEPGTPLLAGQIYESNGVLLASAVRAIGGVAEQLRFVPDDVAAFHAALADRIGSADLVVTSGGVSAGAYEVVKDALAGQGVEFTKVAMQPGGPQGAGRYQGVPVVTLPGNPVSAAISFEIFVRPALRRAIGHTVIDRPMSTAKLATSVTAPAGRRQYRRGHHDPVTGLVAPVGGPGSHLLAALAAADCLFVVPEEVTELAEGTDVQVISLETLIG